MMIKLNVTRKEAKKGCKKTVHIPGTGKSVVVNIRPGEKGRRVMNINDPSLGPQPVQIRIRVRRFFFLRLLLIIVAVILIAGVIANSPNSAQNKKSASSGLSQGGTVINTQGGTPGNTQGDAPAVLPEGSGADGAEQAEYEP